MKAKPDEQLKQEVKSFSLFKIHLSVYVVVIAGLWLYWFLKEDSNIIAWPAYPTVIWGVILLGHYLGVYRIFRGRKK